VNTPTPYEQLIADKLDQVPVPDMSDSIWSGIEMQLDADVDTSVQQPAQKPPKFKGGGLYGLIGIMAVIALIWWYYNPKDPAPERVVPQETLPAVKEPLPPAKDSSTIIHKPQRKKTPAAPVHIALDTLLHDNSKVDPTFKHEPRLPLRVIDTPVRQDNRIQPPQLVPANVQPPPPAGKRARGVKGITDDDYRISTKKDSTAGRRN